MDNSVMHDLLSETDYESLPLIDADLSLWHRVDLGRDRAKLLHALITQCLWRQERIRVYGKSCLQPRLSAWYGDAAYGYSGIRLQPKPWTACLQSIRGRVEALTGHRFNSVLLNYYRDQHDRMGLHSDDEPELGARPVIASLSLGETRDFLLQHKTRKNLKRVRIPLPCGSLLLMRGETQQHWRHGIEREKTPCGPRLNLTFRLVVDGRSITT
jgi:alkylated DNA repair dioxygenase AlkB